MTSKDLEPFYTIFDITYLSIMKIYHNPRCGTSRKALQMITDAGIEPQIVLYLSDPLTPKKLDSLLKKLKMSALDLIRKKEEVYKTSYKDKDLSNDEWIQVMIDHPRLMERPIVEDGRRAVVGRPLDNIANLLTT